MTPPAAPSTATLPPPKPHPPDLEQWYRDHVLVHESALRAYLRRAFPIVTDVDNLVQESFVRVVQARCAAEIANVRSYLFTTARHQALALMRRRKIVAIDSTGELEALEIGAEGPGVAERVGLKLEIELLSQAIATLPPRCREVLTLRKIDGLSQREIAGRLGISENTVEVQVANGMQRCTKFFRERGLLPTGKERP